MRGSAAFRAAVAPGGALAGPWVKNELWRRARAVPSLDLRFAENKSLVDATTGAQLVTFTRASSGTFVGSDGVIRTAVTNLVLLSADFDNVYWDKTRSSISATKVLAPDGSITGAEWIEDTSANTHVIRRAINFTAGLTYTISIFAKATASPRFFQILFPSAAFSSNRRPYFDVVNGTATADIDTTVQIQPFGDGWYRCSATMTATATASGTFTYQLSDQASTNNPSYTGDNASGLFIWGAQLEQSSTVGEYIPTTSTINSAPRFDHNPVTGESLGLLVEEQRTNLALRSEEFDNASWAKANVTVTANSIVAPNGTITAGTLTDSNDVTAATHAVSWAPSFTSGLAYTLSFYAQAGTLSGAAFLFPASAFASNIAGRFNISTGTVASFDSGVTASITNVGGGWFRCAATATATATASGSLQIRTATTSTSFYQGDGAGTIYLWGAQLEAGAFPTSYIPTTTATVTRSADVASIIGSNFSAWYRQDEGTVFAEFNPKSGGGAFGFDDTTSNERIRLGHNGTTAGQFVVVDGNTVQASLTTPANSFALNTTGRVAAVYAVNDFTLFANGIVTAAPDTSGTLPTVTQSTIGNAQASTSINGTLRRLCFWPRRLPDSTLQSITQ